MTVEEVSRRKRTPIHLFICMSVRQLEDRAGEGGGGGSVGGTPGVSARERPVAMGTG